MSIEEVTARMMGLWQQCKFLHCAMLGPSDLLPQAHVITPAGEFVLVLGACDPEQIADAIFAAVRDEAPTYIALQSDAITREYPIEILGAVERGEVEFDLEGDREQGDMSVTDLLIVCVLEVATENILVAIARYGYDDHGQPQFPGVEVSRETGGTLYERLAQVGKALHAPSN